MKPGNACADIEGTHLVHSSISEEQSRIIVWNSRRRGDKGVSMLLEVVYELLAHFGGSPGPGV